MGKETVELKTDCKERVAFDLMHRIQAVYEAGAPQTREEVLKLYRQCLLIVDGYPLQDSLKG